MVPGSGWSKEKNVMDHMEDPYLGRDLEVSFTVWMRVQSAMMDRYHDHDQLTSLLFAPCARQHPGAAECASWDW